MKYIRALAACTGIFFAYAIISDVMEWRTSVIPLMIFLRQWQALGTQSQKKMPGNERALVSR